MTHALVTATAMSSAAINDLPDSAFAYIEPGGTKDEQGKTTPRSLRHFPVHDEAHARNALARAPQSPFGDKAMPKIRAACKKFGIRWSGMGGKVYASAASMLGVELARPGTWQLRTGTQSFSEQMLRDAADFFAATGGAPIPLGFGHRDQRFDGDPAVGWVSNIRYEEDDDGPVLLGDLVDMDDWVSAAAPTRWPNRSVEGFVDLDFQDRRYGLALNRVALLGATPPAMPNLKSLRDLQALVAAAAAESNAQWICASAPSSEEDPQTPAEPAEVPPERKKETGMDPAKFREKLGLTDDLSDDEVMEALAYAGFVPQSAPEAVPEAVPQPVAAAAAPGTIVLASSTYEQLQQNLKTMNDFMAKTKRNERDEVIAKAVTAGKFTPSQKPHFSKLWDADPDGTRTLIDTLTPNSALAVMASGYAGEAGLEEDELDREIARLSPPRISSRGGA